MTGPIPAWLGSIASLQSLRLHVNDFSGPIPAELGNLTNLTELRLSGNELSGCLPAAWRNVQHNDVADLGLPDCD